MDNDERFVLAAEIDRLRAENAALRAALAKIAAPTYGTEIHDTDTERAKHYWAQMQRMQLVASEAIAAERKEKP